MTLDINHFSRLRPYLYHLTSRGNIRFVQEDMVLKSANTLFTEAGVTELSRLRRCGHKRLTVGNRLIDIRDQDPLHAGKISFSAGWTLDDFVAYLNNFVFFWPGWEHGPVLSGRNHFTRYSSERPIILRALARELLTANTDAEPLFCRYNSGGPRCVNGEGSPRGPQTFLPASKFDLPPTRVVEVTFRTTVRLPTSIQVGDSLDGPWSLLRDLRF